MTEQKPPLAEEQVEYIEEIDLDDAAAISGGVQPPAPNGHGRGG